MTQRPKKSDPDDRRVEVSKSDMKELRASIEKASESARAAYDSAVDRIDNFESVTKENLNLLAQSILDLKLQLDAMKTSDGMNKEHIKRLQDANIRQRDLIEALGNDMLQHADKIRALEEKPSLWARFKAIFESGTKPEET